MHKVLFVNSSDFERAACTEALVLEGERQFEAFESADVAGAGAILNREAIDCVVMDCTTLCHHGSTFLENSLNGRPAMLILVDDPGTTAEDTALAWGAHNYLMKDEQGEFTRHLPARVRGAIQAQQTTKPQVNGSHGLDVNGQRALINTHTGLPNIDLFYDRLSQALLFNHRNHTVMALFSIRVTYGGEKMPLAELTQHLNNIIRETDSLCQVDEQHFLVLLVNVGSVENVARVADILTQSISHPGMMQGQLKQTTIKLGIAVSLGGEESASDMIHFANEAREKVEQDNTYQFYQTGMNLRSEEHVAITHDLREALRSEAFSLVMQPLFHTQDCHIYGLEAMVRWQHPQVGDVPASKFLPIAESNGLIDPISRWLYRQACQCCQSWQAVLPKDFRLCVNVAVVQLAKADFLEWLQSATAHYAITPETVCLEIPEAIFLGDIRKTIKLLTEIKKKGFMISLDHFSMSHSCLQYLSHFPVDALKIEATFIRNVLQSKSSQTMVKTIIDVAHNLGMTAMASGVDSLEQRDYLAALGCHVQQGGLFSKPVDAQHVNKMLAKQYYDGRDEAVRKWK